MIKSFATDDHAEVANAAGGAMFQLFERSDSITKSASDAIGRKDIQEFMPPDTHFGVHLISMGAEEDFGPNRNGDSASRESLRKFHPTFEKFGHVFREHKNRCPQTEGKGFVKLARYNERMNRGELFVWVDKEKAPDMYKAAKDGKELSWSMSMRLPYDRCSCCDQKSRNTSNYCSHLRNGMLKYNQDFRKFAYARNEDDVKFFDISEVKRRADRIATYLGYTFSDDTMRKAASEDMIITGEAWAQFNGHVAEPVPFAPWETATLEKLAEAEEYIRHAGPEELDTLRRIASSRVSHDVLQKLAAADFRSVGGELAQHGIVLDFASFASMITGESPDELRKKADFRDVEGLKLPFLLSDILAQGGCQCGEDTALAVDPDEHGCMLSPDKDNIDKLIGDVGDRLGMTPEKTSQRALTIVIKQASQPMRERSIINTFDPFYEALTEAYGRYVVKAAHLAKDVKDIRPGLLFRSIAALQFFNAQNTCQDSSMQA
jgi:hypothetical protein